MADRVGIYLIFYLIKGVAFGNGLHFNVIASMSGNKNSRGGVQTGERRDCTVLVRRVSVSKTKTNSHLFSQMVCNKYFFCGHVGAITFVFLLIGAIHGRVSAGMLELSGTYNLQVHKLSPRGLPGWRNAGTFRILTDVCRWELQLSLGPDIIEAATPENSENLTRITASFDGDEICELVSTAFTHKSGQNIIDAGQIIEGSVPQRMDVRVRHGWLGMLSGCYFRSNVVGSLPSLLLPPEDASVHDSQRKSYVSWSDFGANEMSPGNVVYYTQQNPQKSDVILSLRVLSTTNFHTRVVPNKFVVEEYSLGQKSSVTEWIITSLKDTDRDGIVKPAILSQAFIVDRRMVDPNKYTPWKSVLKSWPNREQLIQGLEQGRRVAELVPQKGPECTSARKQIVRIALALSLATSLWLVMLRVLAKYKKSIGEEL